MIPIIYDHPASNMSIVIYSSQIPNTKIFSIIYVFETPVAKYKFWQKIYYFSFRWRRDMFMDI